MFASLFLLIEMSQKLEKIYFRGSRSEKKYVLSVLELFFFSNQLAISLASFQKVQYCSCKPVVIALAVTVSNNFIRGTVYMKRYAKEQGRVRP